MGEFSSQIHSARLKNYRSAKAFWTAKQPSCSYAQYSLIERGTDLPLAPLAAQIAKCLEIDLRDAMYAWAADSMPSDDLKDLFKRTDDAPQPDASEIKALAPASPPLVINRMQANLLVEKRHLHDILSYMATYYCHHERFTTSEIAQVFAFSKTEASAALNTLYDYGLIDCIGNNEYSCKMHITIPHEADLEQLQYQVFRRAIETFEEAAAEGKKPLRATLTRLLTPEQYAAVEHRFRILRNWVWSLPELATDEAKPHTIGLFGAERRFK